MAWHVMMLEAARRGHKRMDIVSNSTAVGRGIKQLPYRSPNCQENIAKTNTPSPSKWTLNTTEDGSVLSCSLSCFLTPLSKSCSRDHDSSDQSVIFPCCYYQLETVWPLVRHFLQYINNFWNKSMPHSKSLKCPFIPILKLGLNFCRLSSLCLHA